MIRIAIVGGGIAGLAAAYYSSKAATEPVEISVFEQANYWGGKILTERVGDFVIEGGPDTFIVTKPWAVKLCKELGIADRLRGTNPGANRTYIMKEGALHELPGGLTMMIPTEISPMIRTELLSWPEKIRMGMDFLIPPAAENGDESLGAFVTRRLGRAAYENLIEPLMSGIYAGDGDKLSLQATFPYLRELELKHGGLVKGAINARRERAKNGKKIAPGSRSIFLTPLTGLSEIVERLVEVLELTGTDMHLNTSVTGIYPIHSGYRVDLSGEKQLKVDAVILATPAYITGKLVENFAPRMAMELNAIDYVSTATVSLAYHEQDLGCPLDGYGYVIPRREGRRALACTWTSTKFPHRAPERYALIRVFIGRAGQETEIGWDEADLVQIAREEIQDTLRTKAEPLFWRIFIWEKAMPQYNLGHFDKLARIETMLQTFPGLALAGNGYAGIGIPDCIRSGEVAAQQILKVQNALAC